jgi:hypothetical protein
MTQITNCPRCHADLSSARFTERGMVCPHCQAPLSGAGLGAGLGVPVVQTDVSRAPRTLLSLYAVLGVAILLDVGAIAYLFFTASPPTHFGLMDLPLPFVILDVLVSVAVLVPLVRRFRRYAVARKVDVLAYGCALCLLVPGVALAVVIVFFAACLGLIGLKG